MRFRKSQLRLIEPWGYFSPVYWSRSGAIHARLRFKFQPIGGKIKTIKCGKAIPGFPVFVKKIEAIGYIELAPEYKEIPETIYLGSICNT